MHVIWVPGCVIAALPSGTTKSVSGTSPRTERYIFLCSKKRTGSLSRIDERSSPFASYGVDGITTFRPGTWEKKASTDWLWYSAPWPPPPYGARMVIVMERPLFERVIGRAGSAER